MSSLQRFLSTEAEPPVVLPLMDPIQSARLVATGDVADILRVAEEGITDASVVSSAASSHVDGLGPTNDVPLLPPNFSGLVADAISSVGLLRNFQHASLAGSQKRKRGDKKKRGPAVSVVSAKLYHLPGGSLKPAFTSGSDRLVKAHFQAGYGFARECYDPTTCKIKKLSIPIAMTKEELDSFVLGKFQHLQPGFLWHSLNQGGRYKLLDISTPWDIKNLKSNGVLVVTNERESPCMVPSNCLETSDMNAVAMKAQGSIVQAQGSVVPLTPGSIILSRPETIPTISYHTRTNALTSTSNPSAITIHAAFTSAIVVSAISSVAPTHAERRGVVSVVNHFVCPILSYMPVTTTESDSSNFRNGSVAELPQDSSEASHDLSETPEDAGPSTTPSSVPSSDVVLTVTKGTEEANVTVSDELKPQDVRVLVAERFQLTTEFLLVDATDRTKLFPSTSNLTLRQWGLSSGTYHIETDIDSYFGLSPVNIIDDDEETEVSFRPQFQMDVADAARRATSLLTTQQLLIRRHHIVDDAIAQYADPTILNCKLFIRFEGESGEDMEGLTKEFFSVFWKELSSSFLGSIHKFPTVSPKFKYSIPELQAIGRILMHGYILLKYLPYDLCHSFLFSVLTAREPSLQFMLTSLIKCLDSSDQQLVNEALNNQPWSEQTKNRIASFMANYEFTILPKEDTIMENVTELAKYATFTKPYFIVKSMQDGCPNHLHNLFSSVDEETFEHMLETLQPNAQDILKVLRFTYSDDEYCKAHEERVAGYLEEMLVSLDSAQLVSFVKFVTGVEVAPSVLKVGFNGEIDPERMVPTSHTCANTLHVSRYFLTYDSLRSIFSNLLSSSFWYHFDMI